MHIQVKLTKVEMDGLVREKMARAFPNHTVDKIMYDADGSAQIELKPDPPSYNIHDR